MEEEIKILEELFGDFKEDERVIFSQRGLRKEKEFKAIENLINRNKELEEFKKQVEEIENTNFIKYKNYIPKSKVKEKQIKENEIRRNRFLYGNYECPSESYKYKYTDIDMNDYAGMEVNRVLQELLED